MKITDGLGIVALVAFFVATGCIGYAFAEADLIGKVSGSTSSPAFTGPCSITAGLLALVIRDYILDAQAFASI